ncbi:MAG: zf-TFIIB domain-containing protein [Bacteroidetes bacterium]|nr:zf-TFIIB domain-containing protein [Bacteroidota bacterium]
MNCPVCNETLLLANRQDVEIDYCPKCRGIWLDRGELDKIIERSINPNIGMPQPMNLFGNKHHDDDHDYHRSNDAYPEHNRQGYPRHKKKGFLGDLFDF